MTHAPDFSLDPDLLALQVSTDPKLASLQKRHADIQERDVSLRGEMKTVLADQGYPLRENYPNRGTYRKAVAEWRRGR